MIARHEHAPAVVAVLHHTTTRLNGQTNDVDVSMSAEDACNLGVRSTLESLYTLSDSSKADPHRYRLTLSLPPSLSLSLSLLPGSSGQLKIVIRRVAILLSSPRGLGIRNLGASRGMKLSPLSYVHEGLLTSFHSLSRPAFAEGLIMLGIHERITMGQKKRSSKSKRENVKT